MDTGQWMEAMATIWTPYVEITNLSINVRAALLDVALVLATSEIRNLRTCAHYAQVVGVATVKIFMPIVPLAVAGEIPAW